MASKLSNICLVDYRKFLKSMGCKHIRTSSGHEIWSRADLLRPITFQNHIDPVPERIIKQCLLPLGINKKEIIKRLNEL